MTPTAEQQLTFLQQLQQLFEDGDFVATYKYALLMSLAELAVELDSSNGELSLSMTDIAEKFAETYWPQTVPYSSGVPGATSSLLLQNRGKQAAVVKVLLALRADGAATITQAKRLPTWPVALRKISATVADMPVQYLQNVGGSMVSFLYDYPHPRGRIVLKQGVAHMLRVFHPLIQQLSRSGWVRHVRENQLNAGVIGHTDDLEQFMFGSSRSALTAAVPALAKFQSKKCFYCRELITSGGEVDHFIPWTKYPRDLGHNFVLAHGACNRSKSDMLAAERHLSNWLERNDRLGADLARELSGFMTDVECSSRVAHWAYEQGVGSAGYGWIAGKATEPLGANCLALLRSHSNNFLNAR